MAPAVGRLGGSGGGVSRGSKEGGAILRILRDAGDLSAAEPVYIFGTGQGGRTVLRELRRRPDVRVAGFVDSFREGALEGLPVLRAETFLRDHGPQTPVVIASMHADEIKLLLARHGFRSVHDARRLIADRITAARYRRARWRAALVLAAVTAALALLLA